MAKRVFKTTKKLSGAKTAYRPWKEWEVGDIMIGKFLSTRTDNYDKPNYMFEVEDAQFTDFKLAKKLIGENLTLNSNGQLDKAMENVEEGSMVQVTYNGTSTIEKGKYAGKEAHSVEVDLVVEDDGTEEEVDEDEEDDI